MDTTTVITHLMTLETDAPAPGDKAALVAARKAIEHLARKWSQGDVTAHAALRAAGLQP